MACLRNTTEAVHANGFDKLSIPTRTTVALCLVEASRFPSLVWKRCSIAWARKVMGNLHDTCINYSIIQREVVIKRLEGRSSEAHTSINRILENHTYIAHRTKAEGRLHALYGHARIESALNHFQDADLSAASSMLDQWEPLLEPPSLAELAVLFRQNILRAKIQRYQGQFTDSLTSLERCQTIFTQHHPSSLILEDDLITLAIERADSLRELGRFCDADKILRATLAESHQCIASDSQLLWLCFAEVCFAQDRLDQAQGICTRESVKWTPNKMVSLRRFITMAKICHQREDWDGAFKWWTKTLEELNRFSETHSHASLVVWTSLADVLNHQGNMPILTQTRDSLTKLEGALRDKKAVYWIAGLRDWNMKVSKATDIEGQVSEKPV